MANENSDALATPLLIKRLIIMCLVSFGVYFIGQRTIFNMQQSIACSVFIAIIMGTLFFWTFRLAIAFLGIAILVLTNSLSIATFVSSSSLEVIIFLVGMMIIVGALKDLGFFTWVVQCIVSMPNITGRKFIAVTATTSALLACAVDEVTSIIFISTIIFHVCERLKVSATPYIIICVLCTNVGSAGTMMGNPVGIYIGTKAGLTFGDFMCFSLPIMLIALLVTIKFTMFFYRKELDLFDQNLKERLEKNLSLITKVDVPYRQGVTLLLMTITFIAFHHQLEHLLGLGKNSMLLVAPLICAGIVMIWKRDRARDYVEHEVDWWTLIFFMLLFSIAGTLAHTGVDRVIAREFSKVCGTSLFSLVPFILSVAAVGSAFVDNVIFVAAFAPIIEQLSLTLNALPLWWALLFGACFGGNITMIGSTANIVALGMLEKKSSAHITFLQWFKIGFIATLISGGVALIGILALSPFMKDRYSLVSWKEFKGTQAERFQEKNVVISAKLGQQVQHATEDFPEDQYTCFKIHNQFLSYKQDETLDAIYIYIEKNSSLENKIKQSSENQLYDFYGTAQYSNELKQTYPVWILLHKVEKSNQELED